MQRGGHNGPQCRGRGGAQCRGIANIMVLIRHRLRFVQSAARVTSSRAVSVRDAGCAQGLG